MIKHSLKYYLLRYLVFKPLYKFDNVISGKYENGLFNRPNWQKPSRYKWLHDFNFRIAKIMLLNKPNKGNFSHQ